MVKTYANEYSINKPQKYKRAFPTEFQKIKGHVVPQADTFKNRIRCSMTESYDPYRNAVTECVIGILKQEFILIIGGIMLSEMKKIVSESIHILQ